MNVQTKLHIQALKDRVTEIEEELDAVQNERDDLEDELTAMKTAESKPKKCSKKDDAGEVALYRQALQNVINDGKGLWPDATVEGILDAARAGYKAKA